MPPDALRIMISISVPSTNVAWVPEIRGVLIMKAFVFDTTIVNRPPRPGSMMTAGP